MSNRTFQGILYFQDILELSHCEITQVALLWNYIHTGQTETIFWMLAQCSAAELRGQASSSVRI